MKRIAFYLMLTLSLLLFFGCKTNIDSMIVDYNTKFTEDTSERDKITRAPVPGDDDFFEDRMLEEEYYVWEDASLNLSGPGNCSCTWEFLDPDKKDEPVPVHHFSEKEYVFHTTWRGNNLHVNILDSGLETKVYRLKLTAISTGGNRYTDTTSIVIYKHVIN